MSSNLKNPRCVSRALPRGIRLRLSRCRFTPSEEKTQGLDSASGFRSRLPGRVLKTTGGFRFLTGPARESFSHGAGFTLVEALVVAAIFGLLGVTLVVSFSTGTGIWNRAAGLTYTHRQAIVGVERLSLELRRALDYPPIGFSGTETGCYFTNAAENGVLNISYRYADLEGVLLRSSRNITVEEAEAPEEIPERPAIKNIGNFTMSYFGFDPLSGNFEFQAQWNSTSQGLPTAVRVSFDAQGGQKFEKTVLIPAAQ